MHLIQSYESAQTANFFDGVTGSDALEYLLNEQQQTKAEAAGSAGVSKQNLHDFLKGRRELPVDTRLRLAKHFKLDAQIFEFSKRIDLSVTVKAEYYWLRALQYIE